MVLSQQAYEDRERVEKALIIDTKYTGFPEGLPLNAMQQMAVPYMEEHVNIMVVAGTNTGKSTLIGMVGGKYLFGKQKKKIVYIAPMKALVEEKKRSWTSATHPFSKYKLEIVTGDYTNTGVDDSLSKADIIVITPESFASRIRNAGAASWLDDIGMICVDEFHLIGATERGAVLEASLLEFAFRCPDAQLLLLSGTIPNHEELTQWVSRLNNLDTILIQTDWRALPLNKHFIPVQVTNNTQKETRVIEEVVRLCEQYKDDKFLIVVHNKVFGTRLETVLQKKGHAVAFHNADKDMLSKTNIESGFRASSIDKLICTTTLTTGMNLPARRVIETDVASGGGDIPAYDLNQAGGRAGRTEFDTQGDAYFIVPYRKSRSEYDRHVERIVNGEDIVSQMKTAPEIALHFLGAIALGRVNTHKDFYDWYKQTLRYHQYTLPQDRLEALLESIIEALVAKKMLVDDNGRLSLKKFGVICVQMALDPYYLYDLSNNFNKLFAKPFADNLDLAKALASCEKLAVPYPSKDVLATIPEAIKKTNRQEYWVPATIYYLCLEGRQADISPFIKGKRFGLMQDIDRIAATLSRVSEECFKWDKKDVLLGIPHRLKKYASAEQAVLMAQGATMAKAKELLSRGVTDIRKQRSVGETAKIIAEVMNKGTR